MQAVFDLPMASDGRGRLAGRQAAGQQVSTLGAARSAVCFTACRSVDEGLYTRPFMGVIKVIRHAINAGASLFNAARIHIGRGIFINTFSALAFGERAHIRLYIPLIALVAGNTRRLPAQSPRRFRAGNAGRQR